MYNCALHLFKYQPEDGPIIGSINVTEIIISYNLIKYNIVYDCIVYIILLYLAYIQHNGAVSVESTSQAMDA